MREAPVAVSRAPVPGRAAHARDVTAAHARQPAKRARAVPFGWAREPRRSAGTSPRPPLDFVAWRRGRSCIERWTHYSESQLERARIFVPDEVDAETWVESILARHNERRLSPEEFDEHFGNLPGDGEG